MKKFLLLFSLLFAVQSLFAQTNATVRLALISENDDAKPVADLLTAQLSGNQNVQLLERDQIEKVYHEQALSVANQDYLKLGQILGADGLLLLEMVKAGTNQFLNARLLAVKPGVVLSAEKFPWVQEGLAEWSSAFAKRLDLFLPKLTVLPKDAIPISVVNLRSAITSAEATETERQLKLLAIQRLSQERQFFVLERQKMSLLGEEKALKADDSAFWNGSYLLEGVVDQNGHSESTLTINARLTPPRGGAPILLEASGSRTNLAEVINQLAGKVNDALKVNSTVPAWDAADEAEQFFEEAQWALRWRAYAEAEAAAEAAWALGKQDMACVKLRIKAYADATGGKIIGAGGMDHSIANSTNESDRDYVIRWFKTEPNHYAGVLFAFGSKNDFTPITTLNIYNSPAPQSLDHAIRALNLYRAASDSSQPDASRTNSAWCDFGMENLNMAVGVLQHFYLVPKSRNAEASKLTELRALTRSVAAWLAEAPSLRENYVSYIINCGSIWQETPEDCVALYRDFLNTPALDRSALSHFQEQFCWRGLDWPRLVAWNSGDRKRIPIVWNNFIQELNDSTNVFFQAEAKLFKRLPAAGLEAPEASEKFSIYWQEIVAASRAPGDTNGSGLSDSKISNNDLHRPEKILEAWTAQQNRQRLFESNKNYLKSQTNFDFMYFTEHLLHADYNVEEAKAILPLLTNYEQQITGNTSVTNLNQKVLLANRKACSKYVAILERKLNGLISPLPSRNPSQSASAPQKMAAKALVNPAVLPSAGQPVRSGVNDATAAHFLLIKQHFEVPRKPLLIGGASAPESESRPRVYGVVIKDHFWHEGKLVLNIGYGGDFIDQDGMSYGSVKLGAIMILDPQTGHWETIQYPRDLMIHQYRSGLLYATGNVVFYKDGLYLVEDAQAIIEGNQTSHQGQIRKYDFKTSQWETLKIRFQIIPRLAVVGDHLFALSSESILEINDAGDGTQIFASTRRHPSGSTLDSLGDLGSPAIFSGAADSLRARVGSKIYSWNGKDWDELFDFGIIPRLEDLAEVTIFQRERPFFQAYRSADESLWLLPKGQATPELSLYQKALRNSATSSSSTAQPPQPFWELPANSKLMDSGVSYFKTNLYFLVEHAGVTNISNQWTVVEQDNCHAQLVCLSRDCPEPVIIPLKFDLARGLPPLSKLAEKLDNRSAGNDPTPAWLSFSGETLYVGQNLAPGIWAIPVSEVESAVAAQKKIVLADVARKIALARAAAAKDKAAADQEQKNLLIKYDLNHDGIIDRNEREAALDDPVFIKWQLELIDTNQNSQLDLPELAYFDANQNGILDAKEQSGIEITQHLLTERVLQKFDGDGDGLLDQVEFISLWQFGFKDNSAPFFNSNLFDKNHDLKADLPELESYLNRLLLQKLQPRNRNAGGFPLQMQPQFHREEDDRQTLKDNIQAYWKKPGRLTNGPAIHRRPAPNVIPAQNGTP